jgi:hypothetical protein
MQAFVVAVEYLGAGLAAGAAGRRVPVCEHAYELETAALAGHQAGTAPRVGFPSRQRGWNSSPQAARCPDCDTAVQRIVSDLITVAIAAVTGRRPGAAPPAA